MPVYIYIILSFYMLSYVAIVWSCLSAPLEEELWG